MTGYASLGEVAEALRRLAANIEGPDVFALEGVQVYALAALLDTCRTTTDEGVLARAINLKDTLILGGESHG